MKVLSSKVEYEKENIKYIEPMTAKELEEDKIDEVLNSKDYFIEEKLDGTRGLLHFYEDGNRVFSRRISKKTDWFTENTFSVPHIMNLKMPELSGCVIDGEMFIPDREFKDVSSTLNCLPEKAIERQEELGKICFNAFDIIYYKDIDIKNLPLFRRKQLLKKVIKDINSKYKEEYIKLVPYFKCDNKILVETNKIKDLDKYPTLKKDLERGTFVSAKAYYEYIVSSGGEGVIVKSVSGKYEEKRTRAFQKIKKLLTRDLIILDFSEPTREYEGKFPNPNKWRYWESYEGDLYDTDNPKELEVVKKHLNECAPISKYYYENWVGNIRAGVIISEEELEKIPKDKRGVVKAVKINDSVVDVMEVAEFGGFDEDMRKYLTRHKKELINKCVVEVYCNEVIKDSGRLRHPRFCRLRNDKNILECSWKNHINK